VNSISKRRVLFLLPLIVWGGYIFYLSSQPYQDQTIIPYLKQHISPQQLSAWLPDIKITINSVISAKQHPYDFVEIVFRKCAHLFVYSVLGGLAYLAMIPYRMSAAARFIISIGFIGMVASMDELNQTQISMRTGAFRDIEIDLAGGAFGVLVCMVCWRKRRASRERYVHSNYK
jgi:VanZ family protein